jgi:hypothetical protein
MFPFDLSAINILLVAAVFALFIVFITVLMKLNPSTETKEKTTETEIKVERPKTQQTSPAAPRNQWPPPAKIDVPRITGKPLVVVAPTTSEPSGQTKQENRALMPARTENREVFKPEKTVTPAKIESVPSRGDCLHQFGYLRTLPKNAPIPDECFGCAKIVECLVKAKPNEG